MARRIVDSRGTVCPGPVLDLYKAYRQAAPGDELELLATDPAARKDVEAWAKTRRAKILSEEEDAGTLRIVVQVAPA